MTKKQRSKITPTDFFEGCRKQVKVKSNNGIMHAHRGMGGYSIATFFENWFRKKILIIINNKKKKLDPINFHSICFYQAGI